MTGLFRDVRIELKPTADGQKVDIDITPDWEPRRQSFLIDEIYFEGLRGIDEERLRGGLRQKGIAIGVSLLQYSVSKIEEAVQHTSRDLSRADNKAVKAVEEVLDELSVRVVLVVPERIKLIIASSRRGLCQM